MRHIFTLAVCILLSLYGRSQATPCTVITLPAAFCGLPGQIELASNVTINSGETHYASTAGSTYSNINLQGGRLIICGGTTSEPITINGINSNSGDIVIQAGSNVVFTGYYNTGSGDPNDHFLNNEFYNYGTVTFNISNTFYLNGVDRVIHNGGTILSLANIVINGGSIYNGGTITAPSVVLQGNDTYVCMGLGAKIEVGQLNNDATSPNGPFGASQVRGCISYTGTATGNQPLTTSTPSFLTICNRSSTPIPGPPYPAWVGTALVVNNCTSCEAVATLPLKLVSFTGRVSEATATLEWKTAMEENINSFIVERSLNGYAFDFLGEVPARNHPSEYRYTTPISGDNFFRLKIMEMNGRFDYSSIIRLRAMDDDGWKLLTNPVTTSQLEVNIHVSGNRSAQLMVMDNTGRLIKRKPVALRKGTTYVRLEVGDVRPGQYYLHLTGTEEQFRVIPFLKIQ